MFEIISGHVGNLIKEKKTKEWEKYAKAIAALETQEVKEFIKRTFCRTQNQLFSDGS